MVAEILPQEVKFATEKDLEQLRYYNRTPETAVEGGQQVLLYTDPDMLKLDLYNSSESANTQISNEQQIMIKRNVSEVTE